MQGSIVTLLSLILLSILHRVKTDLAAEWISECDLVNRTKDCFRHPPDCKGFPIKPDMNSFESDDMMLCEFVITWQQTHDEKFVNFEVYAPAEEVSEYIAIAFSHDQKMAGSDVYACLSNDGVPQITHSYNTVSHINEHKPLVGVDSSSVSGSYSNGLLNCNFTRIKDIEDDNLKFFHNLNKQFYMLASRGRHLKGTITYHTIGRWISPEKVDFSKFTADPKPTTKSPTPDLGYSNTGRSGGLLGGPCSGEPCQNSGTCTNTKNGFKCVCENSYMGDRCQQKSTGSTVVYSERITLLTIFVTLLTYSCL